MNKIYTKTGDNGQTSLYNSKRVSKASEIIECLGDIDELNAYLGLTKASTDIYISMYINHIQQTLMYVSSNIATPHKHPTSMYKLKKTKFDTQHISNLEQWIDLEDSKLDKLTKFIIPTGGQSTCLLHICRAIARRAERNAYKIPHEYSPEQPVLIYLNRLSDFLFILARMSTKVIDNSMDTILPPMPNNIQAKIDI